MLVLWLYPQTHQLAIFTYSMKQVAFACNQDLAWLGFFSYVILFSQSQINNPDPLMFFFMKKKLYGPFHGWGSTTLSQGQNENHFDEAIYFLPLSFQKLLVLVFHQPLKGKQHKYLNLIQRKEYRLQLKCYFPRRMKISGYTTLVSDTKISKLILCFSILLLQISC